LFNHTFIITSFSKNILSERVFEIYNKRGTMENYIKEAKNSFCFDKTSRPRFIENYARILMSVMAYNIINFMRPIFFEKSWTGLQINTIRLRLFKVAGKVVNTARRAYLTLSSSHVYQAEFYAIFRRIQRIRCYI